MRSVLNTTSTRRAAAPARSRLAAQVAKLEEEEPPTPLSTAELMAKPALQPYEVAQVLSMPLSSLYPLLIRVGEKLDPAQPPKLESFSNGTKRRYIWQTKITEWLQACEQWDRERNAASNGNVEAGNDD